VAAPPIDPVALVGERIAVLLEGPRRPRFPADYEF
jgi:hypothetical protein